MVVVVLCDMLSVLVSVCVLGNCVLVGIVLLRIVLCKWCSNWCCSDGVLGVCVSGVLSGSNGVVLEGKVVVIGILWCEKLNLW